MTQEDINEERREFFWFLGAIGGLGSVSIAATAYGGSGAEESYEEFLWDSP